MVLVKVKIIKWGHGSVRISIPENQVTTISRKAIIERDDGYYVRCSFEPIEGAKEITVSHDNIIFEDEDD